jgi:hypothetical protein
MNIWFNSHYGSIQRVLAFIKKDDVQGQFKLFSSHALPDFPGFISADTFFLEPDLSGDDYVSWCIEQCAIHQIDVFIPFKEAILIQERAQELPRHTRLWSVASADNLRCLHNKIACHQALADHPDWLADYQTFAGSEAFQTAYAQMRQKHTGLLCVKPSVSVYGKGFYLIDDSESTGLELPRSLPRRTLAQLQEIFAEKDLRPQLLMEYLPLHEYSVDAIADHGQLKRMVIRQKAQSRRWQRLLDDERISVISEGLVQRFGLNGLFNIQLKTASDGSPRLLEVNPRPSGGVGMSCLSGVNLPYWALKGFVEGYEHLNIPPIKTGLKVTEISMPVVFPDDLPQ